tara:strand:+ start:557 stop:838 length:282 start_codon:yes stop_codon:yes gene_type:complete
MVVKEKKGRKRYILFTHSSQSKHNIEKFIHEKINILKSKIKCRLIKLDSENGIIRVDHRLLTEVRNIMNKKSGELRLKTIRTSGTLKSLKKVE